MLYRVTFHFVPMGNARAARMSVDVEAVDVLGALDEARGMMPRQFVGRIHVSCIGEARPTALADAGREYAAQQ